ncbi:hypothetical protein TGMAS_213635 [Toxoplasma gondii MAS]|uniref:Uncharacterized protein n=1 Tax=Toxoplasma gondii MAS TaxID=943118 RepID=A0A086QDA9_TOXGO|nr:hypothetical protein TGMAS_213635 [Toxoplasma gondii MAS]
MGSPDVHTGSLHAAGESGSCKKGLLRIRQQYALSTQASIKLSTVLCRNQGHVDNEPIVAQGAHQEGGVGDAKCVGMQSENVHLLGCQDHQWTLRGEETCLLSHGHDSSSDTSRSGPRELRSYSTDWQDRESGYNRGNEVNGDDPACQAHHIGCPTPCPEAGSSPPRFSSPMLSASSLPAGSTYLSSHGFHTSSSLLPSSSLTCSIPSKPPPHRVDSSTILSVPDTTPVLASSQKSCFRETDPCSFVKLTDVPTRWVANPPDDHSTSEAGLPFVRQTQQYTASSDTTSLSRGNMFCEEQQEGMSTSLLSGSVAPQTTDSRKNAFLPRLQGKGGCSVLATAVANAAISIAEEEPLSLSCDRVTRSVYDTPCHLHEDECAGVLSAFSVLPVSSASSSDRNATPTSSASNHSPLLGYNIPQRGGDLQGMKTAGEFRWVYRGVEEEDQCDIGHRQGTGNTGHAGQGTDREGGSCSLATPTETSHAGRQLGVLQTTATRQRNAIERQGQEQNRHQQMLHGSTAQHDEVEEVQRVNGSNVSGSEASSFPPSPSGHLASGNGAKDSDQIAVSVLTTQDSRLENSCTFEESEETHGAFAASGRATPGSSTPTASASNEYFDFNLKGSDTGEYASSYSECTNNVRDKTIVKEEAVKEDVYNRNSPRLPMSTYHERQTSWLLNRSAFSHTTSSLLETHFDDCTLINRPPVDISSSSEHLWVPYSFRATHQPLSAPSLCPKPPRVPDAFPENDTDGIAGANAMAEDKEHKNLHDLRLASVQDESVSRRSTGGFSGCSLSGTDAGETPLGIGNEDEEPLAVQPSDHLHATAFFSALRTHPVLSEGAGGNPRHGEQSLRAGYASQEESEMVAVVMGWGLRAAHNCEDNREWCPFFSEFERTGYAHEAAIVVSRGENHKRAAPLRAFSLSPSYKTGLHSTSGKTEPGMSASTAFWSDPDDDKGIPLERQSPQIESLSSSCYDHGETADLLARGIHGAFVANSTVHEAEGGTGSLSVSRGSPSTSTSGRQRYSRESGNAASTIFLRWTMEITRQFASSSHVGLNITEKREDYDPATEPVFTAGGDSSWDTCCIYCDPLSEKRGDAELEERRTEGDVVSSRLTLCTGSASRSSYYVLERQTGVDRFRNSGFAPCRGAFVRDTVCSTTSMDLSLSPRILSLPTSSQSFPSRSFFPIVFSLLPSSLRLPSVAAWPSPTSQFNSCFVLASRFVIKRWIRLPATRRRLAVCPGLIVVRELLSGERDGLLFHSLSAGITTKEGICAPTSSACVSSRLISSVFCDSLLLRKRRRSAPSLYEGESPRAGDSTREEGCDLSPEGRKELNEEDSISSAFPTLPPDEIRCDVGAPCLRQSGNAYQSDETTACLRQGVGKRFCALKIQESFADQSRRGEKCGGTEEPDAREELSQRVTCRRSHSRQGQILVLLTPGGHEQAWLPWCASQHALTGVEPFVDSTHGGLSEEAQSRDTKESGMYLFKQVDSGSGDGQESATESIIESCDGNRRTAVARGSIQRAVLISSFNAPPVGVSPSIEASASIVASCSISVSSFTTLYLPDPTLDSGGYQLANSLFDLTLFGPHSRSPFAGIPRSHPLAKRRNGGEVTSVSCVAAEVTANAQHRNSCGDSADSRDVRRCSPSLKPAGPTDSKTVTVIDNRHGCGQECLASLLTKHEYSPVDRQLRRTYKDTLNMWTVNRTRRSTLLSYHRHWVFITSARSPLLPPRHQTIALFAAAVCVDNDREQDTTLTTDADRAGAGEAEEAGNEEGSADGNCQNASDHTVPDREPQVFAALSRNARRHSELPDLRRQDSSENEGANAHKHGRSLASEEKLPKKREGESKEAETTDSSPSKKKQHATAKSPKDVQDNRSEGRTRRKRPLCETSNESEKADGGKNRPVRKSPRDGQTAKSASKPTAKKPPNRDRQGARAKGRENKQSDGRGTAGESEDQRKEEIAQNDAGCSPGTSTAEAGHRPQTRNARRRAQEHEMMNTLDNASADRIDRASQLLAQVGSQDAKRERERGELKEQESASPDRTAGAAEHPSKQVGDEPKSEQQSWNEHERGDEGAKTGFANLPSPGQTGNTVAPKTPQKARGRRERRKQKTPQDSADTLEKPVFIPGKTTGAHQPARGRRRRLTSPCRSTPDRRIRRRMQVDPSVSLSLCVSVASAALFASPSAASSAGAFATTTQIGIDQERTVQETHLRANMQASLLSNQRATAEGGVPPHLLVPGGDAGRATINAEDNEKPEETEDRKDELRSGTQQSRNENSAKAPTADRYGEDIVADSGTKDDFPVEQGQRVEAGAFADEEGLRARPALLALLRARSEEEEREALEGGRGKEPGSRRSLRPRRPSWRLCQALEDLVSPGDVLNRGVFLTPSEAEPNEVDGEMEPGGVGEQVNSVSVGRDATEQNTRATPQKRCRRRTTGRRRSGARRKVGNLIRVASPVSPPLQRWEGTRPRPTIPTARTREASPSVSPERASKASTFGSFIAYSSSTGGVKAIAAGPPKREGERWNVGCQNRNMERKRVTRQRADGSTPGPSLEANRGSNGESHTENGNVLKHELAPGNLPIVQAQSPTPFNILLSRPAGEQRRSDASRPSSGSSVERGRTLLLPSAFDVFRPNPESGINCSGNVRSLDSTLTPNRRATVPQLPPSSPIFASRSASPAATSRFPRLSGQVQAPEVFDHRPQPRQTSTWAPHFPAESPLPADDVENFHMAAIGLTTPSTPVPEYFLRTRRGRSPQQGSRPSLRVSNIASLTAPSSSVPSRSPSESLPFLPMSPMSGRRTAWTRQVAQERFREEVEGRLFAASVSGAEARGNSPPAKTADGIPESAPQSDPAVESLPFLPSTGTFLSSSSPRLSTFSSRTSPNARSSLHAAFASLERGEDIHPSVFRIPAGQRSWQSVSPSPYFRRVRPVRLLRTRTSSRNRRFESPRRGESSWAPSVASSKSPGVGDQSPTVVSARFWRGFSPTFSPRTHDGQPRESLERAQLSTCPTPQPYLPSPPGVTVHSWDPLEAG